MEQINQGAQDSLGLFLLGRVLNLIAGAVEDDAGVIAVAHHRVAQIGLVPILEVEVVSALGIRLADGPGIKQLVHDEQSHAVAKVEELRRRRVMCRADGIDAKLL